MLRLHLFPAFGETFVDAISKSDVEEWLAGEAKKVRRASADVLWDRNVVLARRSQTRGDEVMEATKNSTASA
jgi:hypothetical protein